MRGRRWFFRKIYWITLYVFLSGVALSMLIPFIWMCSTSLKTGDQVFKSNIIPMSPYTIVDGQIWEIQLKSKVRTAAGIYRVQMLGGPDRGKVLEVSTNHLTPAITRADVFAYVPQAEEGQVRAIDVKLMEKVNPERFRVRASPLNDPAGEKELEIAETAIQLRIQPQWSNYLRCIRISGVFGRSYINSLIVAILVTAGQVFTSALAAYAFARLDFPGRDRIFLAYLATMMIPYTVMMIPLFVLIKSMPEILNNILGTHLFSDAFYFIATEHKHYVGRLLGLDSYFALIVPGLFSAYGTFMLRQFFLGVPRDLEDAAEIDGCGPWGIFTQVVLPLSKTALATLGIFTFLWVWRDFMWPMVVISSPEMQTLPVMLQSLMTVTGTDWELLMAGTLMVIAPLIVIFIIGQHWFVEGIQLGAVKG